MLIFDQLKKNDPQLRTVAAVVLGGLGILLIGLWWVQVVCGREYQAHLEVQSFRTVRIPAVRGKILDRDGVVLAENRPTYNISLYLEELRNEFDAAYFREVGRARASLKQQAEQAADAFKRRLTKEEKKQFVLSAKERTWLRQKARYDVASNVVVQVSHRLNLPLSLDATNFERHYETRLALPYPVLANLAISNIARFEEQSVSPLGVDLEVQSTRVYPFGTLAAHVLGSLRRDDSSVEGEESFFSFRLPDYRGDVGIEFGFDKQLRGLAGVKSVLVNNAGYRQTENIWSPAEPGTNVVVTIDSEIQQAAERALQNAFGPATRGAVVVMDVNSGDILVMASSPTLDPNVFVQGLSREKWAHIAELGAEKNRATQEHYAPGSIFKIVVGLAALEAGLDPNAIYHVAPNPEMPSKGAIYVGRRRIKDTVEPGDYDFRRALEQSSNSYFITNGLRTGVERIVALGHRFHFGERTGLPTRQEVSGSFPSLERIHSDWTDGNTANLSIGQDPVLVTPLQIAVMISAVANGGKVLWPRLVDRLEPQDPASGVAPVVFPSGVIRDELGLKPRSLEILRDAMLGDTEDREGTGKKAAVPGLRICGKTGTAQVQDEFNRKTGQKTWFASFAPYEKPRWAVVVMVEDGASGGLTCAPIAGKIYAAILKREAEKASASGALATLVKP
jgi:penicillin-binding protein 2